MAIVDDVDKRSFFYKKMSSLLQKKAELDFNYAYSLETLVNREFAQNINSNLSSQVLYQKLVTVILE